MQTTQEHSKLKLALGVITSPSVAFEEILRRRMLGDAFVMTAIAGTLAMISSILRDYGQGTVHLFSLGYANPVTWVGVMMLYALALHFLLKWLGTESDYRDLLTLMGWAQVTLAISHLLSAVEAVVKIAYGEVGLASQVLAPASLAMNLWYLPAVVLGLRSAASLNVARAVMSYMIIHLAAVIGLTFTYGRSRLDLFSGATMGIYFAAQTIVTVDKTSWLAAGFLGLALGIWHLGKSLGWDDGVRKRGMATAAVLGIGVVGGYYYLLWQADYYGKLLTAQQLQDREQFAKAAETLEKLIGQMPGEAGLLSLDVADFSFAAGNDDKALSYYERSLKSPVPSATIDRKTPEAHARVGIGMVRDIRGEHKLALAEFEKAAGLWDQFREPWARSAVTHARMGDAEKAIAAADQAIKKLESKAPPAYVALVQAYVLKGDVEKAKSNHEKLAGLNKDLAERVGKTPEDWKNAVSKLSRQDLRFPLEKQVAKPPERQDPGQARPSKKTPETNEGPAGKTEQKEKESR